nr:hypothetical protein [Tanacetum cinerariifolium]
MLKKFDMESMRTATTPYEVLKHRSKDEPDDTVNTSGHTTDFPLKCSQEDIQCKKQIVIATSSTEAEYVVVASCCGQGLLLVVLVRADDLVPADGCTLSDGCYEFLQLYWFLLVVLFLVPTVVLVPTGSGTNSAGRYSFLLLDWILLVVVPIPTGSYLFTLMNLFLLVVVLFLLVVHTVGLVPTGGYAIPAAYVWYALTHRPTMVFDSLVKQFWATTTVRTLEAGPSDIIATIDGGWNQFPSSLASALICMSTGRTYNFSRFIMDGMLGNVGSKRHKILIYLCFVQMVLGIHTTNPSLRPTFDFTAILFSNMKLNWDGPHMPFLVPMLVVPVGGDAAGAAANVAAGLGPSFAPYVQPMRKHTPMREPSTEPAPDSSSPPSPPPSSATVSPTTSSRPPSPSRHPSVLEDIREGGGDIVSSSQSNEALQTPAVTAAGGAEDSAALTALSLKLDRCLHRVTTLENELGITKRVLGGVVLKLATRVKLLEGLLQQRKRRLVLSDSEGEDATTTEQEFDLVALHTLASVTLGDDSSALAVGPDAETTMPIHNTSTTRRHLRKPFTSSASAHVSETIPAGVRVPVAATTIPAGSSVDAAFHAIAAPSSSIPTVADKGKAPIVDDSLPADLLSEQERLEELAQKAQAESVASPTEHGPGMSDQRRRELDATHVIYTEADWLELLAKIATNSALSKQLLGDDVIEDNMNERVDAPPAKRANQGAPQVPAVSSQDPAGVPATPSIPADVLLPAATSSAPTDILVPAVSIAHAAVSVPAEPMVHHVESHMDDPLTSPEHGSSKPTVATPTPSSSRHRRKHIAKKRVTPIVDMADAAMIKFDSDSDDDPLPYAPYAGWEMVPSPLGSVHAYHDMTGHTKHSTTLREILHMVERTDLQRLLGAVDALYQTEEPDTFALLLWRLYPRAQVHVLEMVDGRVIHMFVDVSNPLFVGTLERMLKHRLEESKLLVGGDLTMAEQLIGFIKDALLNSWLVQEQTALGKDKSNPLTVGSLLKTTWSSIHHLLTDEVLTSPEQTATGWCAITTKGLAIPRVSSYLVKAIKSTYVAAKNRCCCPMILLSLVFLLVLGCYYLVGYCWFCSCCWNKDAILELTSADLSRILKLTMSNSRLGEDCWELQN